MVYGSNVTNLHWTNVVCITVSLFAMFHQWASRTVLVPTAGSK